MPFDFLKNFMAVIRDVLFLKCFVKRMCHRIRIVNSRNDPFKEVVLIAGKQIVNGRIQCKEIGTFDIVTISNQFEKHNIIDNAVRKLQIHSC